MGLFHLHLFIGHAPRIRLVVFKQGSRGKFYVVSCYSSLVLGCISSIYVDYSLTISLRLYKEEKTISDTRRLQGLSYFVSFREKAKEKCDLPWTSFERTCSSC